MPNRKQRPEEAAALRDLYRDLETTIKERAKVKKPRA